jgi:uncharacterized protein YchJ
MYIYITPTPTPTHARYAELELELQRSDIYVVNTRPQSKREKQAQRSNAWKKSDWTGLQVLVTKWLCNATRRIEVKKRKKKKKRRRIQNARTYGTQLN